MNYFFLTIFFRFRALITRHQHSTRKHCKGSHSHSTRKHHSPRRQAAAGQAAQHSSTTDPPRQQAPHIYGSSIATDQQQQPTDSQQHDSSTRQHHAATATDTPTKGAPAQPCKRQQDSHTANAEPTATTAQKLSHSSGTARSNTKQQHPQRQPIPNPSRWTPKPEPVKPDSRSRYSHSQPTARQQQRQQLATYIQRRTHPNPMQPPDNRPP